MYLEHYGLKEKPFQITADPRFLWLGEKHHEALSMLKYGVLDGKGFLLLTGDVGTGKTTLINALLKDLEEDVVAASLRDPSLEILEFYDFVASVFGVEGPFRSKPEFQRAFETFLNEAHARGKKVLLIIDEAQRLSPELLEEIRLLSNIEKEDSKLLNVFFVGQDEFKDMLAADECRALRQRIAFTHQINPLTEREVSEYILHRLKVAGTEEEVFTQGAVEEIFAFSDGYPRLINIICDHALLTGYVKDLRRLDVAVLSECAHELDIHRSAGKGEVEAPLEKATESKGWWRRAALYALVVLALGFCGYIVVKVGYGNALQNVKRFYRERLGRGESFLEKVDPGGTDRRSARAVVRALTPDPGKTGAGRMAHGEGQRAEGAMPNAESRPLTADPQPIAAGPGATSAEALAHGEGESTEGSMPTTDRPPTTAEPREQPPPIKVSVINKNPAVKRPVIPAGQSLVIRFDNETGEVSKRGFAALDQLAKAMAETLVMAILVKGYTDPFKDSNSSKYAELISTAQAHTVVEYLIKKGVGSARIEVMGMGEGGEFGRRVEVEILESKE